MGSLAVAILDKQILDVIRQTKPPLTQLHFFLLSVCTKAAAILPEAVGQRDLRSTVDLLYRDIIPNIGGSDFELMLFNLSELRYVFFCSILTKEKEWPSI